MAHGSCRWKGHGWTAFRQTLRSRVRCIVWTQVSFYPEFYFPPYWLCSLAGSLLSLFSLTARKLTQILYCFSNSLVSETVQFFFLLIWHWLIFFICMWCFTWAYLGFPGGSVLKTPPANAADVGSIPGWGRSSGEGNGNPLHSACLENPMEPSMLYSKGCKRIRHALAGEQQHVCMYIYMFLCIYMYIHIHMLFMYRLLKITFGSAIGHILENK